MVLESKKDKNFKIIEFQLNFNHFIKTRVRHLILDRKQMLFKNENLEILLKNGFLKKLFHYLLSVDHIQSSKLEWGNIQYITVCYLL